MTLPDRLDAEDLIRFAAELLGRAGLDADKARTVADILVEGDLLGHSTHGLALLGPYLDALASGDMTAEGEPEVVASAGATQTWDGRKLPGPWLVVRALEAASAGAGRLGLGAVAIRRSHHIACLAAYLPRITGRGQMAIITCSDPATASVAPFGGTRRLYTPNPLAAGWPTPEGPVLIDVSMSTTTNGLTGRLRAAGGQFEHPWVLDAEGMPTRDPNAFFADPPGSLLPLGGMEAGHKGYALGLLVEALTSALAGHGRADTPGGWGASVLVLVLDPQQGFGGIGAFLKETGWIADQVHATPPAPGRDAVRLPGERGLALRAEQLAHGVTLHPSIPPALAERARGLGITPPKAR